MSSTLQTIGVAAFISVFTVLIPVAAMEEDDMSGFRTWISEHQETHWSGNSELWIDPAGNDADLSAANLLVVANGLDYTWQFAGAEQHGELRWTGEALSWRDSWHQSEGVALREVPGHGSLIAAEYSYAAGEGPDWHWRIKIAERPDGTLVLQMTNIAPWGEEARAVRAVFQRD